MAWLYRCSFAVLTSILKVQVQINFSAENGLLEADFHTGFNVPSARLAPLSARAGSATKETTENIAEPEITKVKVNVLALSEAAKARKRVTARAATDASVSELVITLAFVSVLQDLVSFVDLLELCLIAAAVRMVFNRCPPKGLLDLVRRGVLADTQYFVIITLSHASDAPGQRCDEPFLSL